MNKKKYQYKAFGLNILSEIQLPELLTESGDPDITIQFGKLPNHLENPEVIKLRYQGKPGQYLLKVDNIGKYMVSNGNSITVEKYDSATDDEVRLFLLGSAFGALIHQRHMLPLHASSIVVNNECVLFCGHSGNGKSTTAHALLKRGYALHSDDICVISTDKNGIPVAFPGFPQMKLWEDIIKKNGETTENFRKIRPAINKFAIPVDKQFNQLPLPIKKIFILSPYNENTIKLEPVNGMKKFNTLKSHTYRNNFPKAFKSESSHFKLSASVGNYTSITRVFRPKYPFMLQALIDLLENNFQT